MEHSPFDVSGRVIIVTGAAGQLGSRYTRSLERAGAAVIAWDHRDPEKLEAMRAGSDGAAEAALVELTDESVVAMEVARVVRSFGHIDGVVNNAAMNPAVESPDAAAMFAPYEHYDMALYRRELEVNLVGPMCVIKHVAPHLMARRRGSIVNIASEVSTIAHDHRVYDAGEEMFKSIAYTTSKAAILGFTRQWAARLGSHNVRVNALSIGGVKNAKIPEAFAQRFGSNAMLGRMAEPDEYCATLQYLLSDASSFMTGTNLIVDGGKHAW